MSDQLTAGARHILAAAESLFAVHGYDGVSIQDIANVAGVSKANIYHHFSSKDELYLAVLRYAFEYMSVLLSELQNVDGSIKEQLAHFSAKHLRHLNLKPGISRLILRELLDHGSSRGRDLARRVFGEHFSKLKQILHRGQEAGDVREDVDADHMAVAIAGMNVFLFQVWSVIRHFPGEAFRDQETSGQILFELLFSGLSGHGGRG
jgi:TetR/AcrR family transcriptional regulator